MATHNVTSPLIGTVFRVTVRPGDTVRSGQELVIIESMKMEHPVEAGEDGTVEEVLVSEGDTVSAGQVLVRVAPGAVAAKSDGAGDSPVTTGERADLARYRKRRFLTTDEARPEAVARRAARGHRTARANIADLVDDGSFVEYGSFAIAAQRRRRELDDLIRNTPADGLVGGLATVNAGLFPGRGQLRLHGARRYAGPEEPHQEGPHLRRGAAAPAAVHPVRRGRRGPAR
jgi:pyruvate/2-oxoglutarate dehydrogenase complex dihydrolipoamide acyltransferase (E2) component